MSKISNVLQKLKFEGIIATGVAIFVWAVPLVVFCRKDFVFGYIIGTLLVAFATVMAVKEARLLKMQDEEWIKKRIWNFIVDILIIERMIYLLIGLAMLGGATGVAVSSLDLSFGFIVGLMLTFPVVCCFCYLFGIFKTLGAFTPSGEHEHTRAEGQPQQPTVQAQQQLQVAPAHTRAAQGCGTERKCETYSHVEGYGGAIKRGHAWKSDDRRSDIDGT